MKPTTGTAHVESTGFTPDPWLSERLGVAAFSLPNEAPGALTPAARPAFVQAKVDGGARGRVEELVRAGYALVETAITLEKNLAGASGPVQGVRYAVPEDERSVRRIAASAFTQSRFHADPNVPKDVADRIKADWAANFFAGKRGTHMVVADGADGMAGFLLLILRGEDLVIDLVAVEAQSQGCGLGRKMLDFAAQHIRGPRRMIVGTQLHNLQSLAYYTGYGFRIARSSYTLHRHIS